MDNRQIWKLADELNIYQIVLLIADYDPTEFEDLHHDSWDLEVKKYTAPLRIVIQSAVIAKKIAANIVYHHSNYEDIDWQDTHINVESLAAWLRAKNYGDCFFTEENTLPGFANRSGQFYAPKLEAAVQAWIEVTGNPELLKNKSPKQALDKWLREHALEYGLTLENGNPNNLGITEICKIANWRPEGGATPTSNPEKAAAVIKTASVSGGRQLRPNPSPRSPARSPRTASSFERPRRMADIIDDDIPF